MPVMRVGDGYAFVCGPRLRGCIVCGVISTKQCDYPRKPKPSRARCNARVCDEHAVHVGVDLDWCWPCAELDAKAGAVESGAERARPERGTSASTFATEDQRGRDATGA